MAIDLNNLEVGDTVRYGKSSKCIVNYIKKIDAFTFHVILFNKVSHSQTSAQYDEKGKSKHGGVDIVEIIKNPKQWANEDMITAFEQSSLMEFSSKPLSSDEWLEQYKEKNIGNA